MSNTTKKSLIAVFAVLSVCMVVFIVFFLTRKPTSSDPEVIGQTMQETDTTIVDPPIEDSDAPVNETVEKIIDSNPYIERTEDGTLQAVPAEGDITDPEPVEEPDYDYPEFVEGLVTIGIQENLDSIEDGQRMCAIFGEMYGEPIVVSIMNVDAEYYYCIVEETNEYYSVNKRTLVVTPINEIP